MYHVNYSHQHSPKYVRASFLQAEAKLFTIHFWQGSAGWVNFPKVTKKRAVTPQPRSLPSFLLSSNQAQQVSACLDAMGDSQATPTLMVWDKWMKSTSTQKIGTTFSGLALHGRREEILKTTQTKSGNWETQYHQNRKSQVHKVLKSAGCLEGASWNHWVDWSQWTQIS